MRWEWEDVRVSSELRVTTQSEQRDLKMEGEKKKC